MIPGNRVHTATITASLLAFTFTSVLWADSGNKLIQARLTGFQEVPPVSTVARGKFTGEVNQAATELQYEISYSDLEGAVIMSHIHFGQKGVAGGIMIWLCGTAASPGPAGTPVCPASGTVSRTVTAADVVGPAGQGISAGEFAEALRAIGSGNAYANVHSTKFPAGEIRGQIRADDD
jgi:hypothetical protein